MRPVVVWLGVACLSLVATSPLSAHRPTLQATLEGHTDFVRSVAYSPDGKTPASGSKDETIKLWDVATGKERATLGGDKGPVESVAYSPDGKTLASGSYDQTIKLWDVATGK
jgi:WD40 repeat protein